MPKPTTAAAPAAAAPEKAAAAPEKAAPAVAPAAAAKPAGAGAWLPLILTLVLAPALTWGVGQFVLIPQLQKKLAAIPTAEDATQGLHADGSSANSKEGGGKDGGKEAASYEFQNVVVNLAGTMGTRYLKTSFLVTGAEPNIKSTFEANKPRLTDVTLNVLSSLSLADLEEPGAKNVLREKLVNAYNQAIGRKVADQVYFSDFVVQ